MKRTTIVFALILSCIFLQAKTKITKFPDLGNKGKVGIVAHRGFWQCEQGGNSTNSVASLQTAIANNFMGSEFDVNLTKDGKIIVSHGPNIGEMNILDYDFETLSSQLLPNGAKRPSLEEYLAVAKKSKFTRLVLEVKTQPTPELEDELLDKCIEQLTAAKLLNPKKVQFISFSIHVCERIAELLPEFTNQYLMGDLSPEELFRKGINGLDYHYNVFYEHPDWINRARSRRMSVNVWTVNSKEDMQKVLGMGIDQITTDDPLLARELLAEKEWGKK